MIQHWCSCWETEDDNLVEPAGPTRVFKTLIKSSEKSFLCFSPPLFLALSPFLAQPQSPVEVLLIPVISELLNGTLFWKLSLVVIQSFLYILSNKCSNKSNLHPVVLMAYSRWRNTWNMLLQFLPICNELAFCQIVKLNSSDGFQVLNLLF